MLYNLLLFIGTREKFYISYISYAFCFLLFQTFVTGVGYQVLWPALPKWNNIAGSFLLGASYFFLSRFTRIFLETKKYSQVSDWSLRLINWASAGIMILSVLSYSSILSQFNAFFISAVSIILFVISILCFLAGSRNVFYFVLAFGTFLVTTLFYGLNDLGKISGSLMVLYGPLLASTAEILLLSLALASRINFLKEEKLTMQNNILKREYEFEREKSLSELASQVAHDVQSPLAALNIVIKDLSGISEDNRVLVRTVIDRINQISSVLLKRAKLHLSSRQETPRLLLPNWDDVRPLTLIVTLIENIIIEKKAQYRLDENISIEFESSEAPFGLFSRINAIEFGRVLSNLINNSAEAMEKKGHIQIKLTSENGMVVVSIADTGKGIPNDLVTALGKQGGTYGKPNGTGLGLYHAKKTIEAWDGSLKIDSSQAVGTVITIYLPLAEPPVWFPLKLKIDLASNIVVLDDDESVHQLWKNRIESINWQEKRRKVFYFSDPDNFINWIKLNEKGFSSLYLIDNEFTSSEKTGLDLIEELRLGSESVLVTNGFSELALQKRCEELGVRLLPKGLAGIVPISYEKDSSSS